MKYSARMQFCFRLLFRFHRDFFQWFGRPSSVNTVYTKQDIYIETTCLLLHTFVLLHAKIMFSNTLPIFHWPGKHIVVAYLTLLAESVLLVLNLIVRVKMGLCGWTKFGSSLAKLHVLYSNQSAIMLLLNTHTAAGVG